MQKKTEIKLQVTLDENHIPEKILWNAPDGGVSKEEAKAVLLSIWNENTQEALRIDLWTKDMPLESMKKLLHQTLLSFSQTYLKASDDQDLANQITNFAEHFANKSGIKGS